MLLSVASDGGYYKRWEGPQPHVLLPCQLFAPPTLGFSILSALYVIQMFSSVGATLANSTLPQRIRKYPVRDPNHLVFQMENEDFVSGCCELDRQ